METVYNQKRLNLYQKRAHQGLRLAEAARETNHEQRRQGKTLYVVARPQGNGEHVPSIRVAGKWLKGFGFEIGDEVMLTAAQGQILITKNGKEAK